KKTLKKLKTVKRKEAFDDIEEDIMSDDVEEYYQEPKPTTPSTPQFKIQESFQPGATDYVDQRRFLANNNVGIIIKDSGTNMIEIEFHNVVRYKHDKFVDHFDFTMAALGLQLFIDLQY